jgi:hypothetical protein
MLEIRSPSLLSSGCFHGNLFFSGDDAKEAVKHGVDGILVSNHGARQLDGVPATVSFHWDLSTLFMSTVCVCVCVCVCMITYGKMCGAM